MYVLAGGEAIYGGPVNEIVPYFNELNLPCPIHHNPADFLLEVCAFVCLVLFKNAYMCKHVYSICVLLSGREYRFLLELGRFFGIVCKSVNSVCAHVGPLLYMQPHRDNNVFFFKKK